MFLYMAGDKVLIQDDCGRVREGKIICTTSEEKSWFIVECKKWIFFKEWLWVHKSHIIKKITKW